MNGRLTVACVQMNAGPEPGPNFDAATALITSAREGGAVLIATPENTGFIVKGRDRVLARAQGEADHAGLAGFTALARRLEVWLLIGSLAVALPEEADGRRRVANRSYLIDDQGRIVASYDKIHMFDVDLDGGESYRESATFRPGSRAVVARTPWGGLGLSVCYDLRFPALYRAMAQAGAGLLSIPAAFTVPTGEAHWHVLMRARAIETGCFVLAPAQCGSHDAGRRTFGHSLIIDPWGTILADGGTEPGIIQVEIDLGRIAEVRAMVPSLNHDRAFEAP
jgi:predicted amidohydrolase